jgi:thiol-disulfide isomerase/thioredoxin
MSNFVSRKWRVSAPTLLTIIATTALLLTQNVATHAASNAKVFVSQGCESIKIVAGAVKGNSLPCLYGTNHVTFQAIRGPIAVNVWGSWCEPCRQEIPFLRAVYASGKVAIAGIDVEEPNKNAGRAFVMANKMSWPMLYDEKSSTRGIFGMGVPVTWFIDANGKVVYRQIGVLNDVNQLKSEFSKYLGIKF